MFEVIYISPSCKQAMGFINALAVRLKEIGIIDFKIDREHLQLKTDKFIVSAVSVNGNLLGVSRYHVKWRMEQPEERRYEHIRRSEMPGRI